MGDTTAPPRRIALVLGGGVTKGAFEAGALEVIAARNIAVRRIVAASSGALNAVAFASGVRTRRDLPMARTLVDVWLRDASLWGSINPNLRTILEGRGISDQKKLLALLRRHVKPTAVADPVPIELDLVLAPLRGVQSKIDGEPATTYNHVLCMPGEWFDGAESSLGSPSCPCRSVPSCSPPQSRWSGRSLWLPAPAPGSRAELEPTSTERLADLRTGIATPVPSFIR